MTEGVRNEITEQRLRTAIVFGGTGLVGHQLVTLLLNNADYDNVIVIGRRSVNKTHAKLTEVTTSLDAINVDEIISVTAHSIKHVFCCLGTTRKQAGSKEAFYQVDHNFVLNAGKLAKQLNAESFVFVSALFANANSPGFYSRVKGQVEQSIAELQLQRSYAVRPSLLLGEREKFRLGETLGAYVFVPISELFLHGPLKKYRAVKAQDIAEKMIEVANQKKTDRYAHIEVAQC